MMKLHPTNEEIAEALARYQADERQRMQERLRAGRERRAAQDGRGAGPLVYGYRRGPYDAVEIDPDQAEVVRLILRLERQRFSQAQIAVRLNEAGYRTSRGALWTASAVQQILRHKDLYQTGVRIWHGIASAQHWPVLVAGTGGSPTSGVASRSTSSSSSSSQQVISSLPLFARMIELPPDPPQPDSITTAEHDLPSGREDRWPGSDR
jgi:hypothetical protein